MTPQEVFAQLRDLHTPEVAGGVGTGFDYWPLLIFAACVAVLAGLGQWRRWRRQRARFAGLDPAQPPAAQRDQIARLMQSNPRRKTGSPVPAAFFAPPAQVTAEDAEQLQNWARQRLR